MAEGGPESELDLDDARRGDPALRVRALELDPAAGPSEPARTNGFAVDFVASGSGAAWADAARFGFGPGSLLFFVPDQHARVEPDAPVRGEVGEFHAEWARRR